MIGDIQSSETIQSHNPKYIFPLSEPLIITHCILLQSVPNLYAPSHVLPSELQPDLRSLQLDTEPLPADLTAYDLITDGDMEQLSLEIEKERSKQWKCVLETTLFLSSFLYYVPQLACCYCTYRSPVKSVILPLAEVVMFLCVM
jgi:hypothetical protein